MTDQPETPDPAPAVPEPDAAPPRPDATAAAPAATPSPPGAPAPAADPDPARSAAPPPAPAGAPPRAVRRSRALRVGLVLLGLLVLGPWLLSRTVLTLLVRSQLRAALGPEADLGAAEVGWRYGLRLDRLSRAGGEEGGAELLLREVRLEGDLVRLLGGALFGAPVPGRLAIAPTSLRWDLTSTLRAAAGPEAPEPGTEATPSPSTSAAEAGEASSLPSLPFPLRPGFDLERLDLRLSWFPPGAQAARGLDLLGLTAHGAGSIGADLSLDLDAPLELGLEELRLETRGQGAPAEALAEVRGLRFRGESLRLPSPQQVSPLELETRLSAEVARLQLGDVALRDVKGTLEMARRTLTLAASATLPQGRVRERLAITLGGARMPYELELEGEDVDLSGDLARAVPYLVPLLRASQRSGGGRAGLPPLAITLQGRGELLFGPDRGPLDLSASLRSFEGQGKFRLDAGSLTTSVIVDGYARALTGLGVAGLVEGVLPAKMEFKAAEGAFQVAGGKVVLGETVLRAERVTLVLSGASDLAGAFRVSVKARDLERLPAPMRAVIEAVNEAGGVALEGDLVTGSVGFALPDREVLLRAAQAQGADLLQGGGLRDALDRLGR